MGTNGDIPEVRVVIMTTALILSSRRYDTFATLDFVSIVDCLPSRQCIRGPEVIKLVQMASTTSNGAFGK